MYSIENIIGISRVISTSKIRKITAIKKNCNEKGSRAEFLGSNPHSNGLLFSRSINVFFEIIEARNIIKDEIIKINVLNIIIMRITYIIYVNLLIGSQI